MHWGAKILPIRVSGKCGADLADILDGMRWAAGLPVCQTSDGRGQCLQFAPANPHPARIVNLSFGGSGSCEPYAAVVDELKAQGALVVASAGNRSSEPSRPAKCPGVVGVASLNRDGFKAGYSSFGLALSATGLATVGGDDAEGAWRNLADDGLLSLSNAGLQRPESASYARHFGTSFAAPIVAGAAALMLSLNPQLTVEQLQEGLRKTARPHVTSAVSGVTECSAAAPGRCLCTAQSCGAGILDVTQALVYAQAPSSYVPPAWPLVSIDTEELRAAAALGPDRQSAAPAPVAAPQALEGGSGSASTLFVLLMCLAAWCLQRRHNRSQG
jgi:serine protease